MRRAGEIWHWIGLGGGSDCSTWLIVNSEDHNGHVAIYNPDADEEAINVNARYEAKAFSHADIWHRADDCPIEEET